jgi:hypothetical protein
VNVEVLRHALLWCAVINYALLVVWFLLQALLHDWLHRLWGRWFHLTAEQFDSISFAGIVLYKVGIILFTLVPYIALRIVE